MVPAVHLLIPVKPTATGKSRLADPRRRELAVAFALDTLLAARQVPQVRITVVTDDPDVASATDRLGCGVAADPTPGDLNAAMLELADRVDRTGVLLADLPALRADELETALDAARGSAQAFVADRHGSGTTLYVADAADFAPAFGPGSAARHGRSATAIEGVLPGLRLDVDDTEDLTAAFALGLGPHTAAVLARARRGTTSAPGPR